MRRTGRRLLAVAAVAILPACSDSSGPSSAATGTYTLISINEVLVPVVFSVGPLFTLRITSGTLTLSPDNTFSAAATYEQTLAGGGPTFTETETCTGTYVMSGNTITFTELTSPTANCGGVYSGTFDGTNTLTVEIDAGVKALFRK